MTTHEEKDRERIEALEKGQKEIMELLRPISETYKAASRLGRWGMALLVFVSILIGVILGIKSLK